MGFLQLLYKSDFALSFDQLHIFTGYFFKLNFYIKTLTMKTFTIVTGMLGVASGHTIMQAIGGNAQGVGIYMPSDDSVRNTKTNLE